MEDIKVEDFYNLALIHKTFLNLELPYNILWCPWWGGVPLYAFIYKGSRSIDQLQKYSLGKIGHWSQNLQFWLINGLKLPRYWLWLMTFVTCDRWQAKCDMQHMTHDMWHLTPEIWHVTAVLLLILFHCIGATIRTRREIQWLPYAGYFFGIPASTPSHNFCLLK